MSILYVMAAEAEYGPHLRARIQPLLTGIGPVEAAIALTAALTRAQAAGTLPRLIVSLGSAGSNRLEQCGLYQASSVSYRDMDASALGFPKGVTPYLDQPAIVPLHPMLPDWLRPRYRRVAMSCRALLTPPLMPIWSIWRPSPSCVSARFLACH